MEKDGMEREFYTAEWNRNSPDENLKEQTTSEDIKEISPGAKRIVDKRRRKKERVDLEAFFVTSFTLSTHPRVYPRFSYIVQS